MDSFTSSNKILADTPLPFDVENVESRFKTLKIDIYKKRSKFQNDNNNINKNKEYYSIINPFSRNNKCLKTKKGKEKNKSTLKKIESIIENRDWNEEGIMININEKMASLWTQCGYRITKKCDSKNKDCLKNKNNTKLIIDNDNDGDIESSSNKQTSSQTCARQALNDYCDSSVIELAAYLDETLFIPKKMSFMAEMMYT